MTKTQIIGILNALGYVYNMEELNNALSKKPLNSTKKCVLFSRVSTANQDLIQQNEQLYLEANRNGFSEEQIILIDQKESAVKLDEEERIGIQRLKEIIEKNDVECVIIFEISRLSRRPNVLYSVRDYLIEHNVNLICMKPFMRLLDSDGKMSQTASLLFSIFGSMAETEGYIRKERMRRGVQKKKELGMHAGGQVMFGYKTIKTENGHKYIIDEAEATIVKRIFNEYVNGGKSMRTLTRDLQEEGHFKGIKYLTAVQEVYDILHREHYCGRVKGRPAIISEALYDKSVERRKSSMLKVNHTSNMALLKGLLRDGNTGLLLSSNTAGKYYYSKREKGVSVGMHIIEPIIWDYAVGLHKQFTTLDKESILKNIEAKVQYNMRKQKTLAEKLYEIQKQRDAIEERLIKGRLSEEKAEQLHGGLDKEEKECKQRMTELGNEYEELLKRGNEIYESNDIDIDYETDDKNERYNIVHAVIEKVILKRDEKYQLCISIYNKLNNEVKELKYNCFKKKFT